MTDKELQGKYLGKRIRVPYKYPNGRVYDNPTFVAGICKFIGHNPHLPSWELQITIERMPIPNVDEKTIELITNETKDARTT